MADDSALYWMLGVIGFGLSALFLLGIAGIAAVIYGTVKKNRLGVNFKRVDCPTCALRQPMVRIPASGYEIFWGGYTCRGCGTKLDKWGRVRTG